MILFLNRCCCPSAGSGPAGPGPLEVIASADPVHINYFPGKEIEAIGMVTGNVVQAKHIGRDIMAGFP